MSQNLLVVIPARYQSTRFPGKPLVDLHGKPMIQHVWERVSTVFGSQRVVIATDDTRIADAANTFGAVVQMTRSDHPSGTDRVWEVASQHAGIDWVLNVQGDEPFLEAEHLRLLVQKTELSPKADILTLVTPIHTVEEWQNPNCVKAVLTEEQQVLYFSRSPIPYNRENPMQLPMAVYRHLGVYLYRWSALRQIVETPPVVIENCEKLEQLRAMSAGLRIDAYCVNNAPIGVDTPEDLTALLQQL
jgi:3-deoxy-manno-octulosonate cytidylyltransferase (CMP-KDO synthetase)